MDFNFYRDIVKPPVQAVTLYLIALCCMLIFWGIGLGGIFPMGKLFPWAISAAFLLMFAMMNSLICLRVEGFQKYWTASMFSYLGLMLVLGGTAWLLSGVTLNKAESYRWIFIVVSFGFLVFLSMINFMKKIVKFAEQEDWTQPRPRK